MELSDPTISYDIVPPQRVFDDFDKAPMLACKASFYYEEDGTLHVNVKGCKLSKKGEPKTDKSWPIFSDVLNDALRAKFREVSGQ